MGFVAAFIFFDAGSLGFDLGLNYFFSARISYPLFGKLRVGARTVIIIAHRLSTVRKLAGPIVVLDRDGVAEEGTHEELIARDGWYAEMARLQAVGSEIEFAGPKLVPLAKVG